MSAPKNFTSIWRFGLARFGSIHQKPIIRQKINYIYVRKRSSTIQRRQHCRQHSPNAPHGNSIWTIKWEIHGYPNGIWCVTVRTWKRLPKRYFCLAWPVAASSVAICQIVLVESVCSFCRWCCKPFSVSFENWCHTQTLSPLLAYIIWIVFGECECQTIT